MYTVGKLIYFDPFYFNDNKGSKPKYFLVLKLVEDTVLIASLPSSINHLPSQQIIQHGCLEIPEACINCYTFEAGKPIAKNGWYFPKHTFLYGMWLEDYNIKTLEENYQIENVEFEIIGELLDSELEKVIACFVNSTNVKRKYKRILAGF